VTLDLDIWPADSPRPSPRGEYWRPLANEIKQRQKCALTTQLCARSLWKCFPKVVGATSSEGFLVSIVSLVFFVPQKTTLLAASSYAAAAVVGGDGDGGSEA